MSKKILAVIDAKDSKFKNPAFEVVTEANKLASQLNTEFDTLVIGSGLEGESKVLGNYGAKNIYYIELSELNAISGKSDFQYSQSSFTKIISEFAKSKDTGIILLSANSLGKELAPRIAVRLNASFCPDCINISHEGDELTAYRPVYAGKSITAVKLKNENKVLTLRPNVFKPEKISAEEAIVTKVDVSTLGVTQEDFSTLVKEIIISSEKLDVAEADKIVSGGRGLRGPENFHLIEELATSLGAATGASRAVVDAGWRPHSEQVGQTGKTVSPSLYVACGISGAIQHLAGMSSSKCIVAINKDKDAPIFQIADYGIVGDVFEIIPALTEEIKKVVSN